MTARELRPLKVSVPLEHLLCGFCEVRERTQGNTPES
jgi:hypothetical protein